MIRPTPFPGEIDRSYLGAVMRMNGLTNEDATIALMARWAEVPNWTAKAAPVVELLSRVAGVSSEQFVRQHSTLAFRRAITSRQTEVPHGSLDNRSLLSNSGMRRTRSAAYLCVDCIRADQADLIRSFWRREHQMPGLYWCPKHRIGLSFTEAPNAFTRSPSEFADVADVVDDDWLTDVRRSKPVMRFLC
ncbi:MAG: TniQ family protein [Burkholderiales bacterium]|nr:TniQ family protein [Burkholderiales bacterium]